MKIHCFLLLVIALGFPNHTASADGLEEYAEKDLRKIGANGIKSFVTAFEELTGDQLDDQADLQSVKPWWVKPFRNGNAAWMLLEAYPGLEIPDVSGVRVHVFDKTWKRLFKQSFPTGYRLFLREADLQVDGSGGEPLLVVKVVSSGPFIVKPGPKRPLFEQGSFQRQFFGLVGSELALVRIEDDGGRLVRNGYVWSVPPKGPSVPIRTKDEWIRRLGASNRSEQLAALVWLTGTHLPSGKERRPNVSQESVESSLVFESVRDAAETNAILEGLKSSNDPWIREYANLELPSDKN